MFSKTHLVLSSTSKHSCLCITRIQNVQQHSLSVVFNIRTQLSLHSKNTKFIATLVQCCLQHPNVAASVQQEYRRFSNTHFVFFSISECSCLCITRIQNVQQHSFSVVFNIRTQLSLYKKNTKCLATLIQCCLQHPNIAVSVQ